MAVVPPSGKTEGAVLLEQPLVFDVYTTDDYLPLTGLFSAEVTNDGWKWDRRLLGSESMDGSRHLTYIGGHEAGLTDGTFLSDWVSGVYEGLKYTDLTFKVKSDRLQWIPRVTTGEFTIFWDRRTLFSDYSVSENLSTQQLDHDVYYLDLPDDAVWGSVEARIFQRLPDRNIVTYTQFQQVDSFTGDISSGTHLAVTDSSGLILYNNLNTRLPEFIVGNGRAIFNSAFSKPVGTDTLDPDIILDTWEYKERAISTGRAVYADYFPLEKYSVELVTIDASGNLTSYSERDSLSFSTSTDNHFAVDYDLGVITTGGFQAPPLVLANTISASSDQLFVYPDSTSLAQYPDQGIIDVDGEKILYGEKLTSGFSELVRGYDGTPAAGHTTGATVEDIQHGSQQSGDIYIKYTAVPRVDYEVTDYALRTAYRYSWIDVRATANVLSRSILQLTSYDVDLASIELTIDRPLIGGDLYGPLSYGTDTSRLTATAYDSQGNPVADLPLTIYIEDGSGYLNDSLTEVTGITNALGQIYAYYHAPYSDGDLDLEVMSTVHDGANTVMTVDSLSAISDIEDIWVFQVLKHDDILGTVGLALTVEDGQPYSLTNKIQGYLEFDALMGEEYVGGVVYVTDTGGIRRTYNVAKVDNFLDGSGVQKTRLYTQELVSSILVTGQPAYVLQRDAAEWDPALGRGLRVILYEWTTAAIHPLTGAAGAYLPLHPDTVSGNDLTFNSRLLPIPDAFDNSNNLGKYVVMGPTEVTFRARGTDPYTGRTILSNRVRAQLRLGSYLTGVDRSGALPIPYGFTFATDSFNVGAALGGANFITINPAASGINQFNLTGVF